jgi:WhiB family transcriptional regulator, redox-sensing transcriptional regulator
VVDEAMDWTARARCRNDDPERFFVRGAANARPAIRICQRCPVKDDCLAYALEHEIDFGVWGGLTERQRRAYLRRTALAS